MIEVGLYYVSIFYSICYYVLGEVYAYVLFKNWLIIFLINFI